MVFTNLGLERCSQRRYFVDVGSEVSQSGQSVTSNLGTVLTRLLHLPVILDLAGHFGSPARPQRRTANLNALELIGEKVYLFLVWEKPC
jgi:hypothetical protein